MPPSALERIYAEDVQAILALDLPWQAFDGMTIAVTGAGGFLGGYLLRTLLALNDSGRLSRPLTVRALVRDIARARSRLPPELADHGRLAWMEWDLNRVAIPPLGHCHYVLHAASQASPRFYGVDPVGTLLPNAVGTAGLLQALQSCDDPRGFLFISSSEVYGSSPHNRPLNELDYGTQDPATVRACYAESKRLGETLCVAWHQQYRLPAFIVRPFHTYGPGLRAEDGRSYADFSYNVIRNENIVINGDGSATRAFCYASDAIAGIFTALLKGQAGKPYNVANPQARLTIRELAELLVNLYPEKGLSLECKNPAQNGSYLSSAFDCLIPDVQKLESLGWKARIGPEHGFARMIEALSGCARPARPGDAAIEARLG
ncbi:NAD-dependent epimerase/dehydratase family protein [Chromobacterium vaccinii]|uniref:NAD-dependent epimerase/dehydratase family protein n=1 Tax=Chromobacterium vaccinii TaxID=1108595 RepID=UPI003C77B8DA